MGGVFTNLTYPVYGGVMPKKKPKQKKNPGDKKRKEQEKAAKAKKGKR